MITLPEAKLFLREDEADNDTIITDLIVSLSKTLEDVLGISLLQQTWRYIFERFPYSNYPIQLPRPPIQSVSSIRYVDTDGVQQTFPEAKYGVDLDLELVYLTGNETWPSTKAFRNRPTISIEYVTGYLTAADVPGDLILKLKEVMSSTYDARNPNQDFSLAGIASYARNIV